jgi:hypothetical protein
MRVQNSHARVEPGPNVKNSFTSVIYECSKIARVFVPGKTFQTSPMFVGKARILP